MNVATRKADILLDNYDNVDRFNKGAEQKLKIAAGGQIIRVFGNVIPMRQGEFELKAALDAVIESIYNSGEAGAIVQKYAPSVQPAMPGYMAVKP